mmetsp:Transcript_19924/g.53652  ORF Transcript_19924/g.53652 Transcript_19924/m.53652 type:complete len:368 (-) Transcript_19924:131-1234(-)
MPVPCLCTPTAVAQLDPLPKITSHHRDVQAAQAKLCKGIDKALPADVDRVIALLNGGVSEAAAPTLHRVILQHLAAEGYFEAAEVLTRECGLQELAERFAPYKRLHTLRAAMNEQNLGPALAWVHARQEELAIQSPQLVFALHRLRFLQLLGGGDGSGGAAPTGAGEGSQPPPGRGPCDVTTALEYGRSVLVPAAEGMAQLAEVQQLMGALLYAGRLESSPYAPLTGPDQWRSTADLLSSVYLHLEGLPAESALACVLRVGVLALPTLAKVATVLHGKAKGALSTTDRLPVELELPKEFSFHSIFACPVSREQCTRANPPMALPCGHVISMTSISKLARGCRTTRFKCPYCPTETTMALTREIIFSG